MTMKEKILNFVDKKLDKFISRKLLVLIIGTFLLCFGFINAEVWVTLAVAYITVEGVKDWSVANNSTKYNTTSIAKDAEDSTYGRKG